MLEDGGEDGINAGLRPTIDSSCLSELVLDDATTFHHESDVLQHRNVSDEIAIHRDQVGEFPDLDGAHLAGPADQIGGRSRGCANRLERAEAPPSHRLEFLGIPAMPLD